MATSITQARPLLTAAELELFDHSRASPIKALTVKQLAGKEKRVRALRDKYRDLYRRQTVEQRGKAGKRGKGTASAVDVNVRTQRKADIMQEVLERFEARSSQLVAIQERVAAGQTAMPKAAAKATAKSAKKPVGKAAASKPVARNARKQSEAQTPAPASQKAAGKPLAKKADAQPSSVTVPPRARKPKDAEQAISALAHLQDGAEGAVQVEHFTGQDPTQRSLKAPSDRAPTYGGKAQPPDINAPLDMVASAKRSNPVRQMPGNIAIQGHQSAAVRRAQGKRDSR